MAGDTNTPNFDRSMIDGPYTVAGDTGFWFITTAAVYQEALDGLTDTQQANVATYVQHPDPWPVEVPVWAGDSVPPTNTVCIRTNTLLQARNALKRRFR